METALSQNETLRKKLFLVLDGNGMDADVEYMPHRIYSHFMGAVIILSLIPLAFRESTPELQLIEYGCVAIFIIDYLLRWATADHRFGNGMRSIMFYPLRPMAIIDMLSILPAFTAINDAFNLCRTTRLIRTVRLLKISRYSKEFELFIEVLREKSSVLLSVLMMAILYIVFTALIMFNLDSHFENFFQALYWSTTALTTVGYGDVCPHTDWGRLLSMVSSLVGVAIIALPSCIITASYLKALEKFHKIEEDEKH